MSNPLESKLFWERGKRPITWICNAIKFHNKPQNTTLSLSFGICGVTKRVAFVALDGGQSALLPFVVHDLYLEGEDGCEEGGRCLNFECPRNKTCYTSYIRANKSWALGAFPRKKFFDRFVRIIHDAEERLQKTISGIDWSKVGFIEVFEEAPLEVTVK